MGKVKDLQDYEVKNIRDRANEGTILFQEICVGLCSHRSEWLVNFVCEVNQMMTL